MPKYLLIVESPGKVKTIQKYLGDDYVVRASVGHCFEITQDDNAIDMKTFVPTYSIIKGKEKVIAELKKLSKECEVTYISTDPDREGENIGWTIATLGLDKKAKIKRAAFHEITKTAIQKAIQNPTEINIDLVHAQQARAVLDRLVGFNVSPALWKYVASKTSAGRVQSIGLRIICDRQQEINAFKIEEFWTITGDFLSPKNIKFTANYLTKEKSKNKEETDKTIEEINKSKKWTIKEIIKSKKDRMPNPVFQTSTMQQFASTTFNWNAKKTMSVAQGLYEKGLITYHRTDCVNISKEAIEEVRKIIAGYGDKYLPAKPVFYKSKENAQEAHEGIRPSHFDMTLDEVKGLTEDDQFKLYEAIYRGFVACQMTKAEIDHTKIVISSDDNKDDNKHEFSITGQILRFDGFLKVYTYSASKETLLPQLDEKDVVKLEDVKGEQHFTKPPAQYNDASFIKTLVEKGIGRPSTYASIIETLKKRTYIEDTKKAYTLTELGSAVASFLIKAFPDLMNTNYTARIEEQLDEIANKKKLLGNVVGDFWSELEKAIQGAKAIGKALKAENETDILCPTCKKHNLIKRFSKTHESFYGCAGWSHKKEECECSAIFNIGPNGEPTAKKSNETDILCPTCKKHNLVKRSGKFGPFYGCAGYNVKECSAIFKIGENDEPILIERKEKRYVEGKKCKCGGNIIIRTAHKSKEEFGGCERWPKCKNVFTIDGELIEK